MNGLSIILPVRWDSELLTHWIEMYKKYSELDNQLIIVADQPTWETVKVLQTNNLKYLLVETSNLYFNWMYGSKFAEKDYMTFMQEDFHFTPAWDSNILRRMTPLSFGGAYQLTVTNSDPMRMTGTHFCKEEDNILSFDFNVWEKWCKQRFSDGIIEGNPLIYTLHRDTFNKIYGFGTGFSSIDEHVQHEAATWYRLMQLGGVRWEALDVFCLHHKFGPARDLVNHKVIDPPYLTEWGRQIRPWSEIKAGKYCNHWAGVIKCRDCFNTCDPIYDFGGWPECKNNLKRNNIVLRGYWICDECTHKGSV